jgi:hypothetical protein
MVMTAMNLIVVHWQRELISLFGLRRRFSAVQSQSAWVQATSRPTNISALNSLALTHGSPLVRFCAASVPLPSKVCRPRSVSVYCTVSRLKL